MPAATLQHVGCSYGKPRDYSQTPLNIYWEMTQACALACRHCRAEAVPKAHPMELSFDEGTVFLRQIGDFGDPLPQLILTGGDPLARKDLYQVIDEAGKLGIGVSITPAATPALTREVLGRLKEHGVEGLGLSLDALVLRTTVPFAAFPAHSTGPCRPSAGRRSSKCRFR